MLQYALENQITLWFVLGFSLLAIEAVAFGFGSGVMLFGSFGALCTGLLMWLRVIPNLLWVGIACFAMASAVFAVLLWKPLMALQGGERLGNDRSSDLIGYTFRLQSSIDRVTRSTIRYSGVDWAINLSEESTVSSIAAGTLVRVSAVNAGKFYVISDN